MGDLQRVKNRNGSRLYLNPQKKELREKNYKSYYNTKGMRIELCHGPC